MSWAAEALSRAGSSALLDLDPSDKADVLGSLAALADDQTVEALDRLGREAVRAATAELVGSKPEPVTAAAAARAARRYGSMAEVLADLDRANAADARAAQAERDWAAVLGAAMRFGAAAARSALVLLVSA